MFCLPSFPRTSVIPSSTIYVDMSSVLQIIYHDHLHLLIVTHVELSPNALARPAMYIGEPKQSINVSHSLELASRPPYNEDT